jgi:hypothetical protein
LSLKRNLNGEVAIQGLPIKGCSQVSTVSPATGKLEDAAAAAQIFDGGPFHGPASNL